MAGAVKHITGITETVFTIRKDTGVLCTLLTTVTRAVSAITPYVRVHAAIYGAVFTQVTSMPSPGDLLVANSRVRARFELPEEFTTGSDAGW